MFKPLAIMMGVAMLSLGATAASAQQGPQSRGREPAKVEARNGRNDNNQRNDNGRGNDRNNTGRGNDSRDNGRGNDRNDNDRGVGQDRVWVEDFGMVEERYTEPGHYENQDRQVWVPETSVTVTERVLVPESKYTVEEQVYVEGQNVTTREAHTMRDGSIHYIDRVQWVGAHYECKQVEKCVPAHYEDRQVVKCVPGHYETVCQKVWVDGCVKTHMVRKSIGGHWEVKARR